MRAAIRLAMCIVMTAPAAAAFAGDDAKAGADEQEIQQTEAAQTADAKTAKYDDAEMGAASGEPARVESREARDARARQEAQDLNQQRFLNEVWTQP